MNFEINNKKHDIELIADDEIFVTAKYGDKVFDDYIVSNYGRCYGLRRSTMMSGRANNIGYITYRLCDEAKKEVYAHRLVACSFIENPDPQKYRKIKHLDGNKLNNKPDNLKWCVNPNPIKYDDSVDIGDTPLIANDEVFAIAKIYNEKYKAYLVSNYGRLYSKYAKRIMRGVINFDGYLTYQLKKNGKEKGISAHRLVGFSFVDNPEPLKYNTINHKNEIRLINYFKNLEWCDNDYNLRYSDIYKTRNPKKVKQINIQGDTVQIHDSMSAAAREFNVCMSTVRGWCNRDRFYRGFKWEFAA